MKTAEITTDLFDGALESILDTMTAAQILAIPGVYEVLAEELNNDVLAALGADDDEIEEDSDTWPLDGEDHGAEIEADNAATQASFARFFGPRRD